MPQWLTPTVHMHCQWSMLAELGTCTSDPHKTKKCISVDPVGSGTHELEISTTAMKKFQTCQSSSDDQVAEQNQYPMSFRPKRLAW